MNLYIDLETIPTQDPDVRAQIAESVTPPGNITKAESIDKWNAEKRPDVVKEAIAKTALDGTYGHVCCIGWAFDDYPVNAIVGGNEDALIQDVLDNIKTVATSGMQYPTIVGHNVIGFDLRFLWQRAIILGVKMPHWFPRPTVRPWSDDVFDTMVQWTGAPNNYVGLDKLAKALGVAGKDGIDGGMVAQMWADGQHDAIAEYCRRDIEITRNIHRRMLIAQGEAA